MDTLYRRGTVADVHTVYHIMAECYCDLTRRSGTPDHENIFNDPAFIAGFWERQQLLLLHLATTADQFWVAQQGDQIIGYARSILSNDLRELTEFFMLPAYQSGGIGRELLARAFPKDHIRRRIILATLDLRARVRYLKNGVYPRFPIQHFSREPAMVSIATDLRFVPASPTPQTVDILRTIDAAVLDTQRDAEHLFLLESRMAYLYYRGADAVGYGYIDKGIGPVALLHDTDFPAVLAHAESLAAQRGDTSIGIQVPLINRAVVDYLLERQFQLGADMMLFMSNEPFGKFENYIISSPPLVL